MYLGLGGRRSVRLSVQQGKLKKITFWSFIFKTFNSGSLAIIQTLKAPKYWHIINRKK